MPVPIKYTCLKCGGERINPTNDLCNPCIFKKMIKNYDQAKHVPGNYFQNKK